MNEEKKEIIDVDEEKREEVVVNEDESATTEERINKIFEKFESVIKEQREEKELIRKLTEEIYKTFSKTPREEVAKKEKFSFDEFIERL